MLKQARFLLLSILIVGVCGCSLNINPPDSIESHATKAGSDGISLYVILADQNGSMTTSDGVLNVRIDGVWPTGKNFRVKRSDFVEAKIGLPYEYDAIMFNAGRIPLPSDGHGNVLVQVRFQRPDGHVLKNDTSVYFD